MKQDRNSRFALPKRAKFTLDLQCNVYSTNSYNCSRLITVVSVKHRSENSCRDISKTKSQTSSNISNVSIPLRQRFLNFFERDPNLSFMIISQPKSHT